MSKSETYELINIKLDNLDVDSYQRGLVSSRVDALVANWDIAKVTVPHISARKGSAKWFVVDGQHEIAAAIKLGLKELPAIVWKGQDQKREAEIFHDKQNNRYALTPDDLFNARMIAGDPVASHIVDILRVRNLQIGAIGRDSGGGGGGYGSMAAIKAIEEVYAWGHLPETLDVLQAAFPGDARALQRQFLLAVGALFKNYGGLLDVNRLLKALQGTSTLILRQAAEGMKGGMGGSLWPHLAQLMLHEYNSGLQGPRRLDHFHRPALTRPGKFRLNVDRNS